MRKFKDWDHWSFYQCKRCHKVFLESEVEVLHADDYPEYLCLDENCYTDCEPISLTPEEAIALGITKDGETITTGFTIPCHIWRCVNCNSKQKVERLASNLPPDAKTES